MQLKKIVNLFIIALPYVLGNLGMSSSFGALPILTRETERFRAP